MYIILIGPPTSGKGTQANILVKKYGLHYFATGNLLREDQSMKNFIEKGSLVPLSVIKKLLNNFLNIYKKNILFDGFPRNREQTNLLNINKNMLVIALSLDNHEISSRSASRLICSNCGVPSKLSVCHLCGSSMIKRPDDNIDSLKHRLEVYKSQTEPLIEFYNEKKILKTVNGNQSIDCVSKDIFKCIDGFFTK